MLHMYKNMHYIYINMYTMCKTYGIQTRGVACVMEMDRRLGYNGGWKSAEVGETRASSVLPLMSINTCILSKRLECSEVRLLHRKEYNVYVMLNDAVERGHAGELKSMWGSLSQHLLTPTTKVKKPTGTLKEPLEVLQTDGASTNLQHERVTLIQPLRYKCL